MLFSCVLAPPPLQKWLLLAVSILTCIFGMASTISVFVSMVMAITNNGSSLLKQCKLDDTINVFSVTYECPFDPTRIYVRDRLQTPVCLVFLVGSADFILK